MDIEELRNYCLRKKGVSEDFPFDEDTLVFKVMNKIFCLTSLTPPFTINLKCDPERAVELREKYEEVQPGFHMNKTHWNTVDMEGTLNDKFIMELIDHSYNMVVAGLTKKNKEYLKKL
ncbi:MAG: MmcQ/YjbR family DNA-binding protein [Melioribacteraceae bacterium]|nr:MmcQ/YjbR family DNA-binding protein [Melioribacteraceae bacterium]MCF8354752.1 MmcQ/YjbR family DNA-binding protein [Melioribacteraceae bacterium]MCF8393226.1 MmcQ/YjbR family DNA-binding protein [Melioribacteraceae bacterium]MCF8417527.1 MmcQ/YjbR family DNA-binding protein [Melioribacteraceae bacterium]